MQIFIKTYVCPHCGSQRDSDPNDKDLMAIVHPGLPVGECWACYYGLRFDPKLPNLNGEFKAHSGCTMQLQTDPTKLLSVTISDTNFDDPNLIAWGDDFITSDKADELDANALQGHLEKKKILSRPG